MWPGVRFGHLHLRKIRRNRPESACGVQEPAHRGLPDVFKTNLNTMQCLSDNFPVVSDVCVDAAHTAAAYIFSNKDVLNLSMKQVAVKDVFEGFKVSCASEVARACPGGLLDPSAAVATLPKAPVKGDRHHGHHHRRQLHGGPQEGSFDPLDQLSRCGGGACVCVSNTVHAV